MLNTIRDSLLRGVDLGTSAMRIVKNGAGHFVPKVSVAHVGEEPDVIYRYLDTVGDGTGVKDATGDYSVTPQDFRIAPPAGEVYRLAWLHLFIEDSGGGVSVEKYGSLPALTNGIDIHYHRDGIVHDLTDGLPIKTNGQWHRIAVDAHVESYGAGNVSMIVRLNFLAIGAPLRLVGDKGDRLEIHLNDDFTGLVAHTFFAKGIIEPDLG